MGKIWKTLYLPVFFFFNKEKAVVLHYIFFAFLSMPLSSRTFEKWLLVGIPELEAKDSEFTFYCICLFNKRF